MSKQKEKSQDCQEICRELKYDDNGTAREIADISTKLEGVATPIVGEVRMVWL